MENRPIGVFDSGVGGLTAVKELRKILPNEDIIYFGDTARVPYGSRSQTTIKKYTDQAISFFERLNVKAILAACGTVSSNYTPEDYAKRKLDIPFVTVVEPSAREATRLTESGKIAVMATTASIRNGAYTKAIKEILPQAEVEGQGCPILVTLVENGLTDKDHPVTHAALEMYLEPIKKAEVDTIVLGCTHFPLLRDAIAAQMTGVGFVDSGAAAARELENILQRKELLSSSNGGNIIYYVTDTVGSFCSVAKNFLVEDISDKVKHVDIETIDI